MKLIAGILLFFCLPAALCGQQETILTFYHYADSCTVFAATDKIPEIICRHMVGQFYVTLIGFKGEDIARIAAITAAPITDPAKDISLILDFDRSGHPSTGKVSTWGYIFDRNRDGKVDYVALLGGAGPFEGADMPPTFPRRGQPLSRDEMEYYLGHCKMIFNHIADDNFDGKVDAAVNVDLDSSRDWVKRRILVRSSGFNGVFDDVRGFNGDLTDVYDSIPSRPTAVPYRPVGKPPGNIDAAYFREKTSILHMINEAVARCKIKPEQLAGRKRR
ncbi:MAG TPA: hypothetical protein VMW43_08290 [Bacteroidota bacterium]|nr:hypothetical protein [Bacteroidota bacterium]